MSKGYNFSQQEQALSEAQETKNRNEKNGSAYNEVQEKGWMVRQVKDVTKLCGKRWENEDGPVECGLMAASTPRRPVGPYL
mgnify:CR=1 FL=1